MNKQDIAVFYFRVFLARPPMRKPKGKWLKAEG